MKTPPTIRLVVETNYNTSPPVVCIVSTDSKGVLRKRWVKDILEPEGFRLYKNGEHLYFQCTWGEDEDIFRPVFGRKMHAIYTALRDAAKKNEAVVTAARCSVMKGKDDIRVLPLPWESNVLSRSDLSKPVERKHRLRALHDLRMQLDQGSIFCSSPRRRQLTAAQLRDQICPELYARRYESGIPLSKPRVSYSTIEHVPATRPRIEHRPSTPYEAFGDDFYVPRQLDAPYIEYEEEGDRELQPRHLGPFDLDEELEECLD